MNDFRFGVSPVNYPDPDPDPQGWILSTPSQPSCSPWILGQGFNFGGKIPVLKQLKSHDQVG